MIVHKNVKSPHRVALALSSHLDNGTTRMSAGRRWRSLLTCRPSSSITPRGRPSGWSVYHDAWSSGCTTRVGQRAYSTTSDIKSKSEPDPPSSPLHLVEAEQHSDSTPPPESKSEPEPDAPSLPIPLAEAERLKDPVVSSEMRSDSEADTPAPPVQPAEAEPPLETRSELEQDTSSKLVQTVDATPEKPPNLKASMLGLYERVVQHGLLPKVVVECSPGKRSPMGKIWTATISVDELDVSVSAQGTKRLNAEAAAAVRADSMISRPETLAKLQSLPRININRSNAKEIAASYCQVVAGSGGARPGKLASVTSHDETQWAFTSQLVCREKPLDQPTTFAAKSVAIQVSHLAAAQRVATGHPDLYPPGLGNPFQPKILLQNTHADLFRHFIKKARAYLLHKTSGDTGACKESSLASCLKDLPFPPLHARALVLGAITGTLESAILYVALEQHAAKLPKPKTSAKTANGAAKPYRSVEGDQSGLILAFQSLRNFIRVGAEVDPQTSVFLRQYDVKTLSSIDAFASKIENTLMDVGLVVYERPLYERPTSNLYRVLAGTNLKLRYRPYGAQYSRNITDHRTSSHLLISALGHNIAQSGPCSLIANSALELRMGTRRVLEASPSDRFSLSSSTLKQKLAMFGPLFVFGGRLKGRKGDDGGGGNILARYFNPVSTTRAVLFSNKLSLPEAAGLADESSSEYSRLVINEWLPVLVRSEATNLTHEEARDLLIEAHGLLGQAIDKAIFDFFLDHQTSLQFYMLLKSLPANPQLAR